MSGHSKWSKIKHKKGTADQKKGQLFSKLSKQITIAARDGGDPVMNFKLRIAIDQAKNSEMPKDNIQRAIDEATGVDAGQIEPVTYEGYGPFGTAFIIEAATDSKNRTTSNIRHLLEKYGGSLGQKNSVVWNFESKGVILIEKAGDTSELELAAIDAGAEDVEVSEEGLAISIAPLKLLSIKKNLAQQGARIVSAEVVMEAKNKVNLDEGQKKKVQALYDDLSSDDDVIMVHTSANL